MPWEIGLTTVLLCVLLAGRADAAVPVDSGWGPNLSCTWYSGSCTRTPATWYQNTSGKLRKITITLTAASGVKLDAQVYVGPLNWATPLLSVKRPAQTYTNGTDWPVYFEVPDQHYYKLVYLFGGPHARLWYEKDVAGSDLTETFINETLVTFGGMILIVMVALGFLAGRK